MHKSIASKLTVKGLFQTTTQENSVEPRTSRAFEEDEIKVYILEMVAQLATMADTIHDTKLANRLRSVALSNKFDALCQSTLTDR